MSEVGRKICQVLLPDRDALKSSVETRKAFYVGDEL